MQESEMLQDYYKYQKMNQVDKLEKKEINEASEIINRMIQNNEVVSYLTIYILVSADEKEELKQKCKEVENEVQHQKLKIRNLTNYLQFDGFKAVAPFFTIQTELSKKFKKKYINKLFYRRISI